MQQTGYSSRSTAPVTVPLKPEILVIGGGLTGITVAGRLARAGMKIHLLEREGRLGGELKHLHFFYDRPVDVQQWMDERVTGIKNSEHITVYRGAALRRLAGQVGRFQAEIRMSNGATATVHPAVIVLASGCVRIPSDPSNGDAPVIGLAAMEELLAESGDGALQSKGHPVRSLTYLLDRTNEDVKIHTVDAIKQAILLQDKGCQVAIVARDLKVSVAGMERLYRKAREKGVLFYKYDAPPVFSLDNGKVRLELPDLTQVRSSGRETVILLSDLLVIGEALTADPAAADLARLLKLRPAAENTLIDDNPQLQRAATNRRGIFLAGACRFPTVVSETLAEAEAVVQDVQAFMFKGGYTPDHPTAEVDPHKCAVCYTCVRLCPHAAITMERYADRNVYAPAVQDAAPPAGAARIDEAACFGCGICVAECPARAITLYRYNP